MVKWDKMHSLFLLYRRGYSITWPNKQHTNHKGKHTLVSVMHCPLQQHPHTCMRLSTRSCRAVGGLYLGRMARTKTPSINSCDATRTCKRWPQFFTQASRTWVKNCGCKSIHESEKVSYKSPISDKVNQDQNLTSHRRNGWDHIQVTTHCEGQHDLSEVLVSHDSLLDCFDCISGPEKNEKMILTNVKISRNQAGRDTKK